MNVADSERLSSGLEQLGLTETDKPGDADVLVLNSCVVRQSAEDKVVSHLGFVKQAKVKRPDSVLALMGCMVGSDASPLRKRFPYVDAFLKPQEYGPLLDIVGQRMGLDWEGCVGTLTPPRPSVSAHVPIIHGCDLMCTFCIIPYRRGRQTSRTVDDVVHEVELLASRGVKEVTLLGQTVDAYGHDLDEDVDLADLLRAVDDVDGLRRIRFLTSHPMFMSDRILDAVAGLDKVCEHINLPVQAADNEVLANMRRRYTLDEYRRLVDRIRQRVPHVALSTDVIVGFPGETREQYERTLDLLEEVEFEKVHSAAYSPRPGTIAWRKMSDDVPAEEKQFRLKNLTELQEGIAARRNSRLQGKTVEVLAETRKKGKLQGRTRSDKLVFWEGDDSQIGKLVNVEVAKTSPWSLQGNAV